MNKSSNRPVIGITSGDINGIGPEIIIKTLLDSRILNFCVPVVFACKSLINYYTKLYDIRDFNFNMTRNLGNLNYKQVNLFWNWNEEPEIQPGYSKPSGGEYALKSLKAAINGIKEKKIDALVTAPINKKNIQSSEFHFNGHTEYFSSLFDNAPVLMLMVNETFKIAFVTTHLPINEISASITRENIIAKLNIYKKSLEMDFCIKNPKIAILSLNPHASDDGLIGKEENEIIQPAIKSANEKGITAVGPFPADSFFGEGMQYKFDAVLAMYHDQGLIPFKTLSSGKGVNYTAGLPFVRTSPAHGTAYLIAGKNEADENPFREAIFWAVKILENRNIHAEITSDPLKTKIIREKELDT